MSSHIPTQADHVAALMAANAQEQARLQEGLTFPADALQAVQASQFQFGSEAEVIQAMSDPRYLADEGYRAQVYAAMASAPVRPDNKITEAPSAGISNGYAPFESQYQLLQAVQDVRYSRDSAYRREVQGRMVATDQANLY